jgi:putative acetyltransferase
MKCDRHADPLGVLRGGSVTDQSRSAADATRDNLGPMRVIEPADFGDDRVKALLTRHLEGMHANSPPGSVFALDWSGLQEPEITLYALWEDEELLGFGALKELRPTAGEVKSMRTADAHLRRGVAATILEHLIAEAGRRGYARLSLETGSGPAFEPALQLYRKYGFREGEAFGGYEKSPFNQFLHLNLGRPG